MNDRPSIRPDAPSAESFPAAFESGAAAARECLAAAGCADPAKAVGLLDPILEPLLDWQRRNLLRQIRSSLVCNPDPDFALVQLVRYAEARFGLGQSPQLAGLAPPSVTMLLDLAGFSPFLADLLVRHPLYLDWLWEDAVPDAPIPSAELQQRLAEAVAPHVDPAVRRDVALRAMRRELLRIGFRRMQDLSDEWVMAAELSDLAAAVIERAIAECLPPLLVRFGEPRPDPDDPGPIAPRDRPVAFCVIGMGKLGGRELNFSSDIDLLFVYAAEGRTTGFEDSTGVIQACISNQQFFIRLAEAIIDWIGRASPEGYFYRVDMRLRPEGQAGPLARALSAYELYYTAQAYPWERMALLRGRVAAGDRALGGAFAAMTRPLVCDPLHGDELLAEIYELKQRIDADIADTPAQAAGPEIKRGPGGIREIEFFVQAMQMMHGSRHPPLWVSNTRAALEALADADLLDHDVAERIAGEYRFLRTIEHRLQMTELRQTHRMPADPRALDSLALRCGPDCWRGPGIPAAVSPGQGLMARWRVVSRHVHERFERFFKHGRKADSSDAAGAAGIARQSGRLILSAAPEPRVLPGLEPFGLADPGSLKILRRMGGMGGGMVLTGAGRAAFERMLPPLLELCAVNPRPQPALAALESILLAGGAASSFYETFAAHPALLDLLLFTLGASPAFAQTLVAHPEFFDYLPNLAAVLGDREESPESESDGQPGMSRRPLLERWTAAAEDDEAFARGLNRYRRLEFLLVGIGELAGFIEMPRASHLLGEAAAAIVEAAAARVAAESGRPHPLRGFSILAMGKFGAAELDYHSDLDLIFTHDPAQWTDAEAGAFAGRLVALLTHMSAEGRAFQVDTRLRPEGAGAPLAPHIGRYEEYFRARAGVWEFQSATKLRVAAGDAALGESLRDRLRPVIVQRLDGLDLRGEMRAMRRRMEESRANLPRWVFCDFKAGPGGSADLEFIAQYIKLSRLAGEPALMGMCPVRALQLAGERNWLPGDRPEAQPEALAANLAWLRQLERRARLLFDNDKSLFPARGENLIALERAAPHLAGPDLPLQQVLAVRLRENRSHFEAIFGA